MNKLAAIQVRRRERLSATRKIAAGMSLQQALETIKGMSDEERKDYVAREMKRLGFRGLMQLVINFAKSILGFRPKASAEFKTKFAAEGDSKAKQVVGIVRNGLGIITLALFLGGLMYGLFEPENRETITELKSVLTIGGLFGLTKILDDIHDRMK